MATRFVLLREQTDEQEKWGHRRMGAHCYLQVGPYVVKSGDRRVARSCRQLRKENHLWMGISLPQQATAHGVKNGEWFSSIDS